MTQPVYVTPTTAAVSQAPTDQALQTRALVIAAGAAGLVYWLTESPLMAGIAGVGLYKLGREFQTMSL